MIAQLFTKASNRCASVFASGFTSVLRLSTEHKWAQRTIAELPRGARARGLASSETGRRFPEKIYTEVPWKATSTAAAPVTRTFRSSSQFSEDQTYHKFTPRRPNYLDVKLPEEPYIPEAGPTIPYLPDNFLSHEKYSASPTQTQPEVNIPRVMTVASPSTHHDGGPSHNLHEAGDPVLFDEHEQHHHPYQPVQESLRPLFSSETLLGKVLKDAGHEISIPPLRTEEANTQSDYEVGTELDDEQHRGLFILGGILGGGWFLSRLFS